jgi:AcrR family transcriptional regulator
MPKKVDHETRRQQIADAVSRLVSRHGLDEVSLRTVAGEAGVSMGLVQHYFRTKDEMLLFAFRTLSSRVEARIGAAIAALPQPTSTRSLLGALFSLMLPLDDAGRAEAPVWVAFLARAAVEPALAASLPESNRLLVDFVSAQISAAQAAGTASPSLDARLEAASLLALADGLMVRCVIDPSQTQEASEILGYQLDRILADSPPSAQEHAVQRHDSEEQGEVDH